MAVRQARHALNGQTANVLALVVCVPDSAITKIFTRREAGGEGLTIIGDNAPGRGSSMEE